MRMIRVGVVGAHPERSWARDSHIPAIAQVPGLKLSAVVTRSEGSAREAAAAFGAEHWFTDVAALCASGSVDLIAVCVKVPEHYAVVRAALAGGKHLYCEWPLGRTVDEADALAMAAERAGVHHAIGLQGAAAPAVRRAQALIAAGRIGRIRCARIVSTTAGYAARLPSVYAYLNGTGSGANLTTILGGHTLDLAERLMGEVRGISALGTIQHREVHVTDTGEVIARTTPDHILIVARFANGSAASIEISGDRGADTAFTFEMDGTEGTLKLIGGHPHGFQAGELRLEINGAPETLTRTAATGGLRGAAANVGEVYVGLARDIQEGTRSVAGFAHAARLT